MTNSGVIYVVRNPEEPINYYKVGRSKNSASSRIRAGQTWISEDIEIIKEFDVTDTILAEAAAHRILNPYKIRSEIFECDIDILIGKVKESISPWLSIDSEITSSPWLINLIKEYEFCPSFNCGLCSSKTQKFINELLMRSQTSPLGLGPGERVIHQDHTSQLIKNTKIGNIIEDALKTINLSDLLDVPYWREVLNHLFSLDAKEGFLKFNNDYPPLHDNYNFESRQQWQQWQRISINGTLKICINGFNINQVIDYWSKNNLYKYPDLLLYCTKNIKIEKGFVEGALVNITEQTLKYFQENINDRRIPLNFFVSLSDNLMMGNINPFEFERVNFGEKDKKMKEKILLLLNDRKTKEFKEEEEFKSNLKEIEIEEKAIHLQIKKEWAAILINNGENGFNIAHQYFIDNRYFANRFSRRYYITNINIILYARDYEVSLEQAIWYFYKLEEKKFNIENQKIQLQRKKWLAKKNAKKLRKFEAFQKRSFYIWKAAKEQKEQEDLRLQSLKVKQHNNYDVKGMAIFVAMFFTFVYIFA